MAVPRVPGLMAKQPPKGPADPGHGGEVTLPRDTHGEADVLQTGNWHQDGLVRELPEAVPCLPWQPGAPQTHPADPKHRLPAAALCMEIPNP